jgi:hypothetical protein
MPGTVVIEKCATKELADERAAALAGHKSVIVVSEDVEINVFTATSPGARIPERSEVETASFLVIATNGV